MSQPLKIHPAIELVHGIFDTMGKTVDNVEYSPKRPLIYGEEIVFYFEDGSQLVITGRNLEANFEPKP